MPRASLLHLGAAASVPRRPMCLRHGCEDSHQLCGVPPSESHSEGTAALETPVGKELLTCLRRVSSDRFADESDTDKQVSVHPEIHEHGSVFTSGPRGCGKSRLVSIIGLPAPLSERARSLNGKSVRDLMPRQRARIANWPGELPVHTISGVANPTRLEDVDPRRRLLRRIPRLTIRD